MRVSFYRGIGFGLHPIQRYRILYSTRSRCTPEHRNSRVNSECAIERDDDTKSHPEVCDRAKATLIKQNERGDEQGEDSDDDIDRAGDPARGPLDGAPGIGWQHRIKLSSKKIAARVKSELTYSLA
jgi:hypothetical protein